MGKTIRDEDLKLNIIVNGDEGMNELHRLSESTHKLREANADLRKEKARLRAQGKKGTAEYKAINKSIRENNAILNENKKKMIALREKIGITALSMNELRNEATRLRIQLNNATPNSKQWNIYAKELQKVEKRMSQLRMKAKGVGSALGRLANGFNKYFGLMTAVIASFYGVYSGINSLVQGNAELSDSFANVAKTTGLSIKEVKALNKAFKGLDTRSSKKDLRDLARIAGKLGIEGKQNILDFVKAGDKINVALKEDLGGNTEEAIRQVGKLVDIFKVKDKFGINQALNKVGSTINALGAASTANEGYIVEFTKRLAGIAPTANIQIQQVMGLAATLDSLGQTSEVSSTVFSQLIPNMFKDVATYAKLAGKSTEDFSKTLSIDANEALIQVFEGLHNNSAGLGTMANKLKELGLEGKRNISVIGVMANNTKLLREQQALANVEFEKGTSLTNEFNIKNETLAAKLEKIGKRLRGMFINSSFLKGIESAVSWVERWTRTKLSDTLEEERLSLLKLEIKLTSTNTKHEDRVKMILCYSC